MAGNAEVSLQPSSTEVDEILRAGWGLSGPLTSLGSSHDRVFRFDIDGAPSAVMKVSTKDRVDEMVLTAEAELLRHIVVGKYLSERLRELAVRHREIGALYGRGLYQGVDLVTADGSSTPLPARDVAAICERLRELGCIVASTVLHGNVLKAKPPLCIRRADINRYIAALDRVLTERAEFRTLASTESDPPQQGKSND